MTPKGAAIVIESLSLRVFQIQDIRDSLDQEEAQLKARILELEQIRDMPESIPGDRIIEVQ
jgi:hypothetical protein